MCAAMHAEDRNPFRRIDRKGNGHARASSFYVAVTARRRGVLTPLLNYRV
jgi:hypothetical protein